MYLRTVEILDTYLVSELEAPVRFVDFAIGKFTGFETKNAVKKGIKKKRFALNEELAETGTWVNSGDLVHLIVEAKKPKPYDLKVPIIYEDDFLAVVNKPSGIVVSGNLFKTLENCLVDQLAISKQEDRLQWGLPVHRLDAQTSGLVIFAKTSFVRRKLGEMLETKQIKKYYHAIVHGEVSEQFVELAIEGKASRSGILPLESVPSLRNETLTLVQLKPFTGRTHQLRIHCAEVGSPIVGDKLYASENGTFSHKGLFLAATCLEFEHPATGNPLKVEIEIPPKFRSLLRREKARWERKFT